MLKKLNELINSDEFKSKIENPFYVVHTSDYPFSQECHWKSLIVNKRKPYTYRIYTIIDGLRVCLHRFDECDNTESFPHPHPWPGAFKILKGGYEMDVGQSFNGVDKPPYMAKFFLTAGCWYEIDHPYMWHQISPFGETYTIMVNGPEWPETVKHSACRTTKGKDLQTLSPDEVEEQLKVFRTLLYGI